MEGHAIDGQCRAAADAGRIECADEAGEGRRDTGAQIVVQSFFRVCFPFKMSGGFLLDGLDVAVCAAKSGAAAIARWVRLRLLSCIW